MILSFLQILNALERLGYRVVTSSCITTWFGKHDTREFVWTLHKAKEEWEASSKWNVEMKLTRLFSIFQSSYYSSPPPRKIPKSILFWLPTKDLSLRDINSLIFAKLSQKSKLKLQLLSEMVTTSINPTTHPPGQVWRRYDTAKLRKQKLLSIWVDHVPTSKIAKLGPKTFPFCYFCVNGLWLVEIFVN